MSIEKVTCFVTHRICVKGYDVTLRSEISFTIYPDLGPRTQSYKITLFRTLLKKRFHFLDKF